LRSEIKNKTVLVAMSGGVDSSTAAAVLLEQGYRVFGVTMLLWPEEVSGAEERCCGTAHLADARSVCQKLGIGHYTIDLCKEFMSNVVEPFIRTYLSGRTPNPCILCNEHLKFRHLLRKVRAVGADLLATGHYAKILSNGSRRLARGTDLEKDQSYFLFPLGQEELEHLIFPLGIMTKEEVRRKAEDLELPVHEKPESQDICFIEPGGLRDFISSCTFDIPGSGRIVDREGNVLGTHEGACFFTVGQRKGLGIAAAEPLYVIRIDVATNTVVVGAKEDAFFTSLIVPHPHWVEGPPPKNPFRGLVQIRHRHTPADCLVEIRPDGTLHVVFDEPQHGVAPGQAAVIYDGDILLGGGWIDSSA
jgi:tRNA-specific 2-thiouridylase